MWTQKELGGWQRHWPSTRLSPLWTSGQIGDIYFANSCVGVLTCSSLEGEERAIEVYCHRTLTHNLRRTPLPRTPKEHEECDPKKDDPNKLMAHPQETRAHTNLDPTQRRTPAAPCGKHQTSHMRPDVHRHSQRLRTAHPVVPRDDGPPAATKRIVGLPTSSVAPEVFFGDHPYGLVSISLSLWKRRPPASRHEPKIGRAHVL